MSMTNSMAPQNGEDWLKGAARAGYAARGLVFIIVGYFSFRAAFASGQAMDTKDAIEVIAGSGFGTILLAAMVIALAAFCLWRLIQVAMDVDNHGIDAKGVFVRTGLLISAFSYGALAVYSVTLLLGQGAGSGSGGKSGVIAYAYEAGFGVWLTYLIAAGMAAAAIAHLVKGVKAGFEKYMAIPSDRRWLLKPVCQFGLIARAVTFVVLAGLLATGAAGYESGETPGIDAALREISSWSFGWLFLSLTGLGLVAFGVYSLAEAMYRRIEMPDVG
ncbi:DUF1206 domain-containing protein [Jiella sp. MQZ9-1]|uniref:DUF1206 domain-containing protein n=1 Tax=Jiella flava TaxID=2816857 RepID=A0A939G0H1_9HYPH|nr:DUF1206 domain-containing protein [Jiella flava]MBO0663328.1 DUF1206 domain-containing protein [Jiella flava]MCD2471904.1 DUF1206 domain-containing protein [Jiella flava]